MTALIVIAAVALVLFTLLASSLTVDFEYDESFSFKVKYLFFTIIMNPNSPRWIKRKEKKEAKRKKKEEKIREKEKKKALKKQQASPQKEQSPKPNQAEEKAEKIPSEKGEKKDKNQEKKKDKKEEKKKDKEKNKVKMDLDLIISIIKRASPHVKRIFKKIRFYDIIVDITIGGDDAATTALSYGAHCSAVYSLVAFLQNTVTFKAKMIDVKCNFNLEKTEYYASGTVKLRLSTLLHSSIWGGCAVLLELYKANKAQSKEKVSSKKEKSGKAA